MTTRVSGVIFGVHHEDTLEHNEKTYALGNGDHGTPIVIFLHDRGETFEWLMLGPGRVVVRENNVVKIQPPRGSISEAHMGFRNPLHPTNVLSAEHLPPSRERR